jgi:hypothetical protein
MDQKCEAEDGLGRCVECDVALKPEDFFDDVCDSCAKDAGLAGPWEDE